MPSRWPAIDIHDDAVMPITFVGGGNMAGAIIGGLRRAGTASAEMQVIELDTTRGAALRSEFGVPVATAADQRLATAEVIVLAVKPQQLRAACEQIAPLLVRTPSATAPATDARGPPLLLSIAAGIRARDIARWTGVDCVIRAMPNTPALIGRGISGVAALAAVSEAQRQRATTILEAIGAVVWFEDEAMLDPVTAVSGSGPAYVFYFIEALMRAGRELGFNDAQARALAVHTFAGAAQLASTASEPVATLRERVTSKGGTTAAALASLEASHVTDAIVAAVRAANRRARELGDEFGG